MANNATPRFPPGTWLGDYVRISRRCRGQDLDTQARAFLFFWDWAKEDFESHPE